MTDLIPGYDLERPTVDDLVIALEQILGPNETQAALAIGLRELDSDTVKITDLSSGEVLELAYILTKQRGLISVLARSFAIRLHSFEQLLTRDQATDMPTRPSDRLSELAALRLGEKIDDPVIQAIVDRAADDLHLPLAAISIVLDSAQYFIASHGMSGWLGIARGSPVEWAFCRHAVASREPFVVEDAGNHPVVRDNPLVQIDGIRCYLGMPLITSKDQAIGTLCVLGVQTRSFSPTDLDTLRELAARVMSELEMRRSNA